MTARKRKINERKRLLVVEGMRRTVKSGRCADHWTDVLLQQLPLESLEMLKDCSLRLKS